MRAPFLDQLSILIEDSAVPGDDASSAVGVRLQCLYCRESVDRIAEDDRAMEFPFEDGQKRESVDARSLAHQAGGDRQTEKSMSHRPAERVVLRGRMIHMERIEISGESREQDDIRFGDGSSRALPLIADHEIIE